MTRSAVWALLALALATLAPAPAAAQPAVSLVVNVHTASALGCGDYGAGPHYSYRVLVDGVQVATSGTYDPTNGAVEYYDLHTIPLGGKSTVNVSFEVDDHAFSLFGESGRPCNLTSDDQTRYSLAYTVGQPQLARSAGAHQAAGIEAYVSDTTLDAAQQPAASITGAPRADAANVTYAALHVPGFERAELRNAHDARALLASSTTAGGATLAWTQLAEDASYAAIVRAIGGPWIVNSNEVDFTTANLPPPTPALTVFAENGTSAELEYRNAPADLARLDVFVAREGTAFPTTPNVTLLAPFFNMVQLSDLTANVTYAVRATVTDNGGLTTNGTMTFRTDVPAYAYPPPSPTPTRPPPPFPTPPVPTPTVVTLPDVVPPASIVASLDISIAGDGASPDQPLLVRAGGGADVQVVIVNHANVTITLAHTVIIAQRAQPGEALPTAALSAALDTDISVPAQGVATATMHVRAPTTATAGANATLQVRLEARAGVSLALAPMPATYVRIADATAVSTDTNVHVGPTTVIVGVGGTIGIAAVASVLLRRDATRFALAAALYTRISRGKILDHPARAALHQRIASEPGVCYTQLKRETGMNTGALVHHLRSLEDGGYLTSRKEGAFRRFYVTGSAPPKPNAPTSGGGAGVTFVPALTPMQARVLELVREKPMTQGELAIALGLTQQGVSHHVKALERAGHVTPVYDGKAWRYQPATTFEIVP